MVICIPDTTAKKTYATGHNQTHPFHDIASNLEIFSCLNPAKNTINRSVLLLTSFFPSVKDSKKHVFKIFIRISIYIYIYIYINTYVY